MENALKMILSGKMKTNTAATTFNVPPRTLYDRIKRIKAENNGEQQPATRRRSRRAKEESACFPTDMGRNIDGNIYIKQPTDGQTVPEAVDSAISTPTTASSNAPSTSAYNNKYNIDVDQNDKEGKKEKQEFDIKV